MNDMVVKKHLPPSLYSLNPNVVDGGGIVLFDTPNEGCTFTFKCAGGGYWPEDTRRSVQLGMVRREGLDRNAFLTAQSDFVMCSDGRGMNSYQHPEWRLKLDGDVQVTIDPCGGGALVVECGGRVAEITGFPPDFSLAGQLNGSYGCWEIVPDSVVLYTARLGLTPPVVPDRLPQPPFPHATRTPPPLRTTPALVHWLQAGRSVLKGLRHLAHWSQSIPLQSKRCVYLGVCLCLCLCLSCPSWFDECHGAVRRAVEPILYR
jgi:hypothetical protein